jgi:hypothetical protein
MNPHLREELERLLPAAQVEELLRRAYSRAQVELEPGAVSLNRGHYFEVLDRVHVAAAHIEEHIGAHPVLRRHRDLALIYDRAAEALADLYQAVGRMPALAEGG